MIEKKWHSISWEEVISLLKTDPSKGLNEKEARERRKKWGFNSLPEKEPLSKVKIFLEQFKSPLIYILIIAGVVTIILGKGTDAIVIFIEIGRAHV